MKEIKLPTQKELIKLFSNLAEKRITDDMYAILIKTLWRDKVSTRQAGFYWPGAFDCVMTWEDAGRTLTLTPRPAENPDPEAEEEYVPHYRFFSFAGRPVLHRKYEAESIQLPDSEGLYLIYYDTDDETRLQLLTYAKNPDEATTGYIYMEKPVVAWIYWNSVSKEGTYVGDSRHGSEWNKQIAWVWHMTVNSQRQEGIGIAGATFDGEGDDDADFQFEITGGKLWHEDIYAECDGAGMAEALPVWYFNAGGFPRAVKSGGRKFLNAGAGLIAYNKPGVGLAEAGEEEFVAYHYFATNCMKEQLIAVAGQGSYIALGGAVSSIEAEVATLRQQMPHSNMMHIGSVVLQTSSGYGNTAKARVVWASTDTDTFTTDLIFDPATRILTLKQNNNTKDLEVEIPGGEGEDGASAYEVAVANGFVGTEAEWLESLKGKDGYTPVKGVDYFDGEDGLTPEIGANGNWYIGEFDTGVKAAGADGKQVEMRNDGTYIQWRLTGGEWANLVALSTLQGAAGKNPELRVNAGWLEWRLVGDANWTQLYEIPTSGTGLPPGGTTGQVLKKKSDADGDVEWADDETGDGGGGGTDNFVEVALDFYGSTSFTYTCPCAMKFTSVQHEASAPTLDIPLNTNLAKFDKLTITATAAGLVILQGVTL